LTANSVATAQDVVRGCDSQRIPFPLCLFRIHLNIILPSTPRNSFQIWSAVFWYLT